MKFQKLKENRGKILFTILTVAFVLFIFSNSLQNGENSSKESGTVVQLLQSLFHSLGITAAVSEHIIRKTAHFCEYAVLGALLGEMLRRYTPRVLQNIFVPLFIGLAVPVADECIQLFSAGRTALVLDVVLDFSGMLTGLALTVLCILLHDRRRKGHGQEENR